MRAFKIFALAMAVLMGSQTVAAQTPAVSAPAETAQSLPSTAPVAPFASVDANYVIGLGDVIEVAVVGQAEYSARVRVSPDGNVLLPLIGNIPAANRKPSELASLVGAGLTKGGFYSQPVVRVEVVTVASRFVTVLGQVGSPGIIPLDRAYRLSEILARVGARFGSGGEYVVITHANGTQDKLSMTEIATGAATQDPIVVTGDKIYVPAAEAQVFYVSGSVRSPGAFPMAPGITVRTALARAGGITENGSEKKFDIFRGGEKLPKPNLETTLEVGDIVKFGERMF